MRHRVRLVTLQVVIAALVGAAASLHPGPALAREPALDVALAAGWDGVQDAGWVPYVVTIANRGPADFAGTVRLVPEWRSAGVSLPWQPPVYESPVSVRGHTAGQRLVFYVRGERYYAEVVDRAGRTVRRARLTPHAADPAAPAAFTVGLLGTDAAEAQVRSLSDVARVSVYRFAAPADLPANPVVLGNLGVVLLAGADAAALAPAQVAALERYVELGGTLAMTGGSGWRRTLAPLPAVLAPLRPDADGEASLQPLAALAGGTTAVRTAVATGRLTAGRVLLDDADGTPLAVEAPLGAGHVVELTFDPAAAAGADRPLAEIGWGQAVFRANGALGLFGQSAGQRLPVGFGYAGPVDATWMLPALEQLAAAPAAPPLALLGGLLLGPACLLGLAAALLAVRRRPPARFWIVPLVLTLVVPAGLGAGGVLRQSDTLVDSEVQLLLPAPPGQVLSVGSHALFATAPGDYRLRLLPGSVAGRLDYSLKPLGPPELPDALWDVLPPQALGSGGWDDPGPRIVVSGLASPELDVLGTGTGPVLSVETASLHAVDLTLDAHLRVSGGRVLGTIVNRGSRPVRGLRLYGGSAAAGSAERALLSLDVRPGGSATVDAALKAYAPEAVQPMVDGPGSPAPPSTDAAVELAAARVIQRPGQFVLAGVTDPLPEFQAGGSAVRQRAVAVVVSPVRLAGVDVLPDRWSSARPVSLARQGPVMVDVYELDLPPGPREGLTLFSGGSRAGLAPGAVDVYDWEARSWRPLPAGPLAVALAPSEARGGVVRVRAREATPVSGDWDLRAGDSTGRATGP
jgi:hypothetical protein